ncbi:non-specific lipid-transfer protein-like protein [Panicum miliaceum]|uniref:Non-specific lipid-transfer protein-like protein n=1 Tax=Panicum miliaceum TaxID=4540 RepID=A0A3L6T960_PANMI|nr:non-specific lipid-transfer protein-like protein [Panicum miliaceum]
MTLSKCAICLNVKQRCSRSNGSGFVCARRPAGGRHGGGGGDRAARRRRGAPVRRAGDVLGLHGVDSQPGAVPLLHARNTSAPGASCCPAVAGVVRGAPRCLCAVLGGGAASLGVTVNATRALELPGKCRIQTPPVSQCNAVGAPASSPPAPAATVEAPAAPPPVYSTTVNLLKPVCSRACLCLCASHAGMAKSAAVFVSFVVAVASLMAF